MELKLNDDEVRYALIKALQQKVNDSLGTFDVSEGWFEVKSPDGEVEDIESVEFCVRVET